MPGFLPVGNQSALFCSGHCIHVKYVRLLALLSCCANNIFWQEPWGSWGTPSRRHRWMPRWPLTPTRATPTLPQARLLARCTKIWRRKAAQETMRHLSDIWHIRPAPRARCPRRPPPTNSWPPPPPSTPRRGRLPTGTIPGDISSTPRRIQITTPTPLAAATQPLTTAAGSHPAPRPGWPRLWPPSSRRCTSRAIITPRPCSRPSS